MRILFATWDGAGNLPPALALIAALTARGHELIVLGHDSQRQAIEQHGGHFRRFLNAPQLDQGKPQGGFDFDAWFRGFNDVAANDFMDLSDEVQPNLLIIDSMMGPTLEMGWSTGLKMVALVHGAYSVMSPWADAIKAADLALGCSYPAFDDGATFPPNLIFVGPLRPAVPEQPVEQLWQRKSPDLPLVTASLSSGHQGPFQLGLLQRLCDALSTLPIEALVTTGRGIAPEEVTAAANVSILRNVDHTLSLPETSLFITHCGHGSVMAALHAGVPMLSLPPVADQPHNAQLLKRLGLGETIDVMAPSALIAEATSRLLANTTMQTASKAFAAKHTFDANPSQAVELIEKLVS